MHLLKSTKEQVFVLPRRVLLAGKGLKAAGALWLEHAMDTQPDHGYVDVALASNVKQVMRVSEKNIVNVRDKYTTAMAKAFAGQTV